MGWWDSKDEAGVIIGDEPLDLAYKFVEDLAACYRDGTPGRSPTPAELAMALQVCLSVSSDAAFGEDNPVSVTKVSIRTTKRRKTQRYAVGDLIAFDLEDGRYAFARIMVNSKVMGLVLEVFRATSGSLLPPPNVTESGRVGPVFAHGTGAIETWLERVVAHDPSYEPSEADKRIEMVTGSPLLWTEDIYSNRVRGPISKQEAAGLPKWYLAGHSTQVERIRMLLDREKDGG